MHAASEADAHTHPYSDTVTAPLSPRFLRLSWQVESWDNLPDLTLYVGDSLRFEWSQPNETVVSVPPHGVSILDPYIVSSFLKKK